MPKDNKIGSDTQTTSDSPEKTSQQKKRRNYKKELEKTVAEKNDLRDKLLRTAAEFDNFRKRVNNEKPEWMDQARAQVLGAILPVFDDLQRVADVEDEKKDYEALHAGLMLVLKNFSKILGDLGLVEMETVNQPFDPEKHDALMQMSVPDVESDIVVDQHVKGYEYKDKVLRHAKVIVSK